MKIPSAAMPRIRAVVVIGFMAACALFFSYLWTNMGGTIPGVSSKGYRVTVQLADADNLVYDSDVMVAGVRVGKVRDLQTGDDGARVLVQLDDDAVVPLHEGATVRVRSKSLIEETYLEITDGSGAPLADDSALPANAVKPSVQLDQVLLSLDRPTRASLRASLQSLGKGTAMTHEDISRTMTGLGMIGAEGHDVLDAIAAQSTDLRALVRQSQQLVSALDTGRGQIVSLVDGAERLTRATADSRRDLAATMTRLPTLMTNARTASGSLIRLSTSLAPVARDVRAAASPLNDALVQLPAVTRDLRGLMPALNRTLTKAPATLTEVPGAAADLQALVPTLQMDLADLNPMLAFLKPYARDLTAFFSTWDAMLASSDVNGHYLRIMPILNEQSAKLSPLPLNYGLLDKSNAYPAPGESTHPGPFDGTYPHVERDPR
jgi:phospholipid/cholesterol/gamma-HCH transport system substrate-binding protein